MVIIRFVCLGRINATIIFYSGFQQFRDMTEDQLGAIKLHAMEFSETDDNYLFPLLMANLSM